MTILSKTESHSDAVDYFKELPFYNQPIEKPKVKRLKNIDRLIELPFYEQLGLIFKLSRRFKLKSSFQEILNKIDNWINEDSG